VSVDEEVLLVIATSVFALATAWAAWVSKSLVAIMATLSGAESKAVAMGQDLTEVRTDMADHEVRIRGLETHRG